MAMLPYNDPGHYGYSVNGNLFNKRICYLKPGSAPPGHPCIGENRIFEFDGFFHVSDMNAYVAETKMKPQTIAFEDIWFATRHPEQEQQIRQSARFKAADPSFPGLLAPVKNPADKPYRMLDGRRRMWKLADSGAREGLFYVFEEPQVYEFFWMLVAAEHAGPT
jgi:hypothetical protein